MQESAGLSAVLVQHAGTSFHWLLETLAALFDWLLALFRVEHVVGVGVTWVLLGAVIVWALRRLRREAAARMEHYRELKARERMLARERAHLEGVLASISEGVVVHDKGVPTFVNRAFTTLMGYPEDDLVGQPVLNFLADPDARAEIRRRMAGHDENAYSVELIARSGEAIPVSVEARMLPCEDEEPQRLVLIRDQRQHREVERRMLAQQLRMRELYALTTQVQGNLEVQLTSALEKACQLLGLDWGVVSHIEGRAYTIVACHTPDADLHAGDVLDLDLTYCSLVVEQGGVVAVHHMGASPYARNPCYAAYGLEAYIGAALYVGGTCYGTIAFSSPRPRAEPFTELEIETVELIGEWVGAVLERQQLEAEREALAARNEQVLNSIADAFFSLDSACRFTYLNAHAEAVFGQPAEAVLGKSVWALYPEAVGEVYWEAYHRALETGETQQFQAENDGRCYAFKVYPFEGGLSVFFQDVTARRQQEQRLARSEARQRALLDALPDLMFRIGRDGTYRDVHAPSREALVVSAEDILGARIPEVIPEPMASTFMALIERTLATGEVEMTEYALPVVGGETRYFDARVAPVGEDEVIFVARDITDRHRQQEALRESEERLELAVSGGDLGLWDWNVETSEVTYSERWASMLGYALDEIDAHVDTWTARVHPEDLPEALETVREHFEGRTPRYEIRHRMQHRDGSWRWILSRGKVVERTAEGAPLRAAGTHLDITEQVQAARLVAQSEERFRLLAENMQDLVCLHNPDASYRWVSPSAQALLGYDPEAMVGRSPLDFIHPDDAAVVREELFAAALATERPADKATYRVRRADGTYAWLETAMKPIVENGAVVKLQTTSREVTRRVEAMNRLVEAQARAEAADQAKSAFLANMSHEIRTPMNGIIGMAELLAESALDDGQREHLDVILNSSEALLALINDILDFSKIEAGQFDIVEEPFELHAFLDRAVSVVAVRAAERRNAVTVEKAAGLPARIVGDELRIRQVLLNLLSNAVKFTEGGEVIVEASLLPRSGTFVPGGRAYLQVAVHDTGMGIPADKLDRLFERFDQLDSSTTRKFGGTGLGLAISQRLVGLMGGTIEVESEPGRGSTFRFTVEVTVPAEQPESDTRTLAGTHVLFVDDHPHTARVVAEHTARWGMACTTVTSGAAAIDALLSSAPVDLVVVGERLPDREAAQVAGKLKEIRPRTPVALLTTRGAQGLQPPHAAQGFDDWIASPLRRTSLYELFTRVLLAHGKTNVQRHPAHAAPRADGLLGTKAPLSVLLVEDARVNQAVALRLLNRLGYAADVAENGQEAVEAVCHGSYDVVFMDVQMPVMDGVEATRLIRSDLPEALQPWIIGLTANAVVGDRERYLNAGMDDYLSKPVRLGPLEEALRRAAAARHPIHAADLGRTPIVDLEAVSVLRDDLGAETFAEVLLAFTAAVEELAEAVRRGSEAEDWDAVERAAHTLHGTAASLGAQRLGLLGQQLEQAAAQRDVDVLPALVNQVGPCAADTAAQFTTPGVVVEKPL